MEEDFEAECWNYFNAYYASNRARWGILKKQANDNALLYGLQLLAAYIPHHTTKISGYDQNTETILLDTPIKDVHVLSDAEKGKIMACGIGMTRIPYDEGPPINEDGEILEDMVNYDYYLSIGV